MVSCNWKNECAHLYMCSIYSANIKEGARTHPSCLFEEGSRSKVNLAPRQRRSVTRLHGVLDRQGLSG
jgi:hypothetical protein